MNCVEFQQTLPELMDGVLSADTQRHLQSCADCATLVADLNAIAEQAHLLPANLEPPARVWISIERQLRQEGLIRDPKPDHRLFVLRPNKRWAPVAWLTPIAAALVVAALMILPSGNGRRDQGQSGSTAPAPGVATPPFADPQDLEIMAEVEKNAPAMRAAYAENLRHINEYLADARKSVAADPNDDDAQQYLLQASEQKAMLYQMALDGTLP
jgi:hypothetical protein